MNFLKIIALWVALALVACDGADEPIPAYLQIDEYKITPQTAAQGQGLHSIRHVWVYANSRLLGGFSLPATIPVLESGDVELIIDPGVRDNGISELPRIYPFYTRYTTTVNLTEGEVLSIEPEGTYANNAIFGFVADFEENNIFTDDRDGDTDTGVDIVTEGARGQVGKMVVTTDHPVIEAATIETYPDLPLNGVPVYLEIDYRNDIPFLVGIVGLNEAGLEEQYFPVIINAKGDWNKIYINLTEVVSNSRLQDYQIVFYAELPSNLEEATVWLDNVKLLYR